MITAFHPKITATRETRPAIRRLAICLLAAFCLSGLHGLLGPLPGLFQPLIGAPAYQRFSRVCRLFEESLADEKKKAINWERIIRDFPKTEYALYIQAEGVDSYRKQIRLYDRALRINPKFFEAYIERARAKAELENLTGALTDVNQALQLRPGDFGAFIDRGDYRQRAGKFTIALADFSRALKIARSKNDRGLALLFRGETQLEMGNAPAAILTANRALSLLANNPQLLYLRGRANLKAGNKTEGCRDLAKAIQLGEHLAEMQQLKYCASR